MVFWFDCPLSPEYEYLYVYGPNNPERSIQKDIQCMGEMSGNFQLEGGKNCHYFTVYLGIDISKGLVFIPSFQNIDIEHKDIIPIVEYSLVFDILDSFEKKIHLHIKKYNI